MRLHSKLRFAPAAVDVERRPDGSMVLRSPQPLRPYERCVGEWLAKWARQAPERVFLAERQADAWRKVTYAQALDAARRIGQALLERGLGPDKPVAIL
ncbi:MAG: feruloyl-CoA synthase, partial [Betaproteobacteria bacterium]|nr:feruloyl-CoA synthase [Betaproteobacteria bacterium]